MKELQQTWCSFRFLLTTLGAAIVFVLLGAVGAWTVDKALAADAGALTVGSAEEQSVSAARSGFSVSSTRLDLSPKVKKVPYGHKYIPRSKTVTVRIPDSSYYPVYFKTSNQKVATAKWAKNYKEREIKLTVYGHARGKATLTITNGATYEKKKIYVTVRGYDSTDFRASKTKLDLSPKERKVKGGVGYTERKSTIVVAVPDQAKNVYFKSSDTTIADAKWSKKWNGNTTKLTITGHRRGAATITLANTKTKKKVKVKVVVGGYGLGFNWGTAEKKKYSKASGKKGSYLLNNFILANKTGKAVRFDKKCAFRCWTVNANYDAEYDYWYDFGAGEGEPEPSYYSAENQRATIRNLPVTVKKGKSKKVYIGNKIDIKKDTSMDTSTWDAWDSAIFTVKVGKSYKTVYVDNYGMVTNVLNGRKIK